MVSVAVLLGLCFSIFSSVMVFQTYHLSQQEDSIMTLNVCNSQGTALQGNLDIPFLFESPYKIFNSGPTETHNISFTSLILPLVVIERDYPPEV